MRVANKLKPEIKAIRLKLSMGLDQRNFKTRPSSYLFQIARGSGATLRWMYFFFKKHKPLEDPKKRYTVSLRKALRQRLYLLGRTWRNKTRLPKLNHEILGGLSILGCFCNQERTRCWPHPELSQKEAEDVLSLFSTNKNTKFIETMVYTKLFTRHKHSRDQESLSRQ